MRTLGIDKKLSILCNGVNIKLMVCKFRFCAECLKMLLITQKV